MARPMPELAPVRNIRFTQVRHSYFNRSPDARSGSVKGQLRILFNLVWQERRSFLPGAVCVLVGMVATLAYPQAIRITIDQGLHGGTVGRINQLAIIMLALLVLAALATYWRNYLFNLGAE